MMHAITDTSLSKEEQQQAFLSALGQNPEDAKKLIRALVQSGIIKF